MTSTAPLRPPSRAPQQSALRGIVYLMGTIFMFGLLEATAKYVSASYPVPQVVWARLLFQVLLFLPFVAVMGFPAILRTRRPVLQLVRSGLMACATVTMFTTLTFIPLADANAIVYLSPVLVTALSVPLLGERVGIYRWCAVIVAFLGVLVIMRPGLGIVHWGASLALITALAYAFYQIVTRTLRQTDSPLTTMFYTPLVGVVVMSAVVPFYWVTPDLEGWLLMALTGIFGGLGHFLLIKALDFVEASTLQPYQYLHILWAAVLGYFVFGDFPDLWTCIGAVLVLGSGLFIFHREAVRGRR